MSKVGLKTTNPFNLVKLFDNVETTKKYLLRLGRKPSVDRYFQVQ